MDSDEIDGFFLISDQMGCFDTNIEFLDEFQEFCSVGKGEKWFLSFIISDMLDEFFYVGEKSGLLSVYIIF